jgi:hypothetical protein
MKLETLLNIDKPTLISLISEVAAKVRSCPEKPKHKALRDALLKACDLAQIPKA